MSIFVMTDIHGCYDAMNRMLEKIGFSGGDQLIMAGDYIDRGPQSYEMLRWIEAPGNNVTLIRGNHDEAFAYYVELMRRIGEQKSLDWDSVEDTMGVYSLAAEVSRYFDYYGTIRQLVWKRNVCFRQLSLWAACIKKMPYHYWIEGRKRRSVVVHAGYVEDLKRLEEIELDGTYQSIEDFWLNARDDAYLYGGVEHGMVLAGHTPTIARFELPYNHGQVYRFYDPDQDCVFYDLDCGYVFGTDGGRTDRGESNLACMRVDDERIFYLKEGQEELLEEKFFHTCPENYDIKIPNTIKDLEEDILKLPDLCIQRVARDVDSDDLAVCVYGFGKKAREKIIHNLSKRYADEIMERVTEMSFIGEKEMSVCGENMVEVIRTLVNRGEIIYESDGK